MALPKPSKPGQILMEELLGNTDALSAGVPKALGPIDRVASVPVKFWSRHELETLPLAMVVKPETGAKLSRGVVSTAPGIARKVVGSGRGKQIRGEESH